LDIAPIAIRHAARCRGWQISRITIKGSAMKKTLLSAAVCLVVVGAGLSSPAQARHYRHYRHYHQQYSQNREYRDSRDDHGNCLRFNKTTGTVAGAVGGGLLGSAIFGGTGGALGGAAVGGLAGHELAHNGRKRC